MKNQILRVPLMYGVFGLLYYLVAYLIDKSKSVEGEGISVSFQNGLNSVFFWAQAHVSFLFIVVSTALFGLLFSHYKNWLKPRQGFLIVFLISISTFLLLLISSYISF
jgi:hypothetical protein